MKWQSPFSGKNKKNINLSSVSSTESAQRVVKVLCEWIHTKSFNPIFQHICCRQKVVYRGQLAPTGSKFCPLRVATPMRRRAIIFMSTLYPSVVESFSFTIKS